MARKKLIRCMVLFLLVIISLPISETQSRAGDVLLTKGWDMFGEPLSFGQVGWSVSEGQGPNNFKVAFQLSGSQPNHEFTVGVHLFNPANLTARPNVTGFGSLALVGEGITGREGKSAFAIAYDFGGLKTNAAGDGFAQFDLNLLPGTYYAQFTVRIGGVNTCRPSQGTTHGCAVAYRTGNQYAQSFEIITISSSSVGPPPQTEGWQGNFAVKMVQMSADGNVFFKVANPDGMINHMSPVVSDVQPQIAQGFLTILLHALETGKKVKIHVKSTRRNSDGGLWRVIDHIQVGEGNF